MPYTRTAASDGAIGVYSSSLSDHSTQHCSTQFLEAASPPSHSPYTYLSASVDRFLSNL